MKFGLLFTFQLPPRSGIAWSEPYQDMLQCLPRAEELTIGLAHPWRHGLDPELLPLHVSHAPVGLKALPRHHP